MPPFSRTSSAVRSTPLAKDRQGAGEECFRAVFDSAPIGMALVDRARRVVQSNPRLLDMLGYRAEDIHRVDFADIAFPDVVERDSANFAELLAGASEGYEIEGRFRHRDGEEFLARMTTAPLRLQGGACALRIIEDVTARQRLEEQLRQAQKMEAIGRLAGGLAHDFNNLLTVIKGYSDALFEDLGPHPHWQGQVDAIREASTSATALTSQLLAFGRKQQLKLQPLGLNAIVSGVQVLLSRLIPASIELRVETAPDLGAVHADATQLEQVLINLAVNARDAMPRGGTLSIRTANVELDEHHAAKYAGGQAGSYVVLTVADTGAGMDDATRARIFEPFFTTKGHGRGTGLGLATVFNIVKQSGGNVSVQSELGAGTTFQVYLPRVAEAVVVPKAPVERAKTSAGGHETVLLVEDQEDVRELLVMALRRAGYSVIEASNGQDALVAAESCPGTIAVLVTDVIMPKLNGPDLYQRLLKTRPGLKVVFMSGYTEDHVRPFAVERHAAFLEKPFSQAHLTRTLRTLIESESVQEYASR